MSRADHRVPPTPVVERDAPAQTPIQEITEAFNLGRKLTVTPRGGEATELVIRQFYTDQLFDVMDQVEKVWNLAKSLADEKGNLDLFSLFKQCKEEAMLLISKAIEKDRKEFVGKLELDDLMAVFQLIFEQNKDFFEKRVKNQLTAVLGLISSIS